MQEYRSAFSSPTMQAVAGFLLLTGLLLLSLFADCGLSYSVKQHCAADDKEPWSYHGRMNGPLAWGRTFPQCNGNKQSPVPINSQRAIPHPHLQKLFMNNYGLPITRARIVNIGHTVQITPQDGVPRSIQVEGKTFTLQQIHFHWGSTHHQGSEHTLDGQQYVMEGHLVHASARNEIAVVAVIFQERHFDNPALQPITNALLNIPYKNSESHLMSQLNLNAFVPQNPSSFYRYTGSLTIPGCSEGVIWSVLKGIQPVGSQQMAKFRNLYSAVQSEAGPGCKLVDNFRPLQPLNNRLIYSSQ